MQSFDAHAGARMPDRAISNARKQGEVGRGEGEVVGGRKPGKEEARAPKGEEGLHRKRDCWWKASKGKGGGAA